MRAYPSDNAAHTDPEYVCVNPLENHKEGTRLYRPTLVVYCRIDVHADTV